MIYNLGSINIDRVYTLDHFVAPGETEAADAFALFPGGKGFNQSIALARAGAPVTHIGAIGPDGEGLRDYLRTAKEIWLTDPFIRQPYQIDNLVDFIQMVRDVTSVQDTIKIHLSTQNEDDEKVAEVIDSFNDLADELLPLGIEFTYDFKADHDRMIQTDTGWTITLGRGLDIYEKFGRFSLSRANQQNRRCKAFNVSINHTQNETNN